MKIAEVNSQIFNKDTGKNENSKNEPPRYTYLKSSNLTSAFFRKLQAQTPKLSRL